MQHDGCPWRLSVTEKKKLKPFVKYNFLGIASYIYIFALSPVGTRSETEWLV